MLQHFQPGALIVLRDVEFGVIHAAMPVVVVRDDSDLTAMYLPEGTAYKRSGSWDFDLAPALQEVQLEDRYWSDRSTLILVEPGASHSVNASWTAAGFEGWYVNFQEPLRRTPLGFDTADKVLDLIVAPDLSSWRWKDQGDFERAQRSCLISAQRATELKVDAAAVVERIQNRAAPFCDGWENWRPAPSLALPVLPAGWDRLDKIAVRY